VCPTTRWGALSGTRPSRRSVLALAGLAVVAGCGEEPVNKADGTIRYGDDPSQYAEIYHPSGSSRGVVVVIHGGFWKARYDASLGRPLARSLADEGWTAWNLEYRRVGNGGGIPETLDDVAVGIDALADVEGLDTTRVITLGHSAGGHLATWAPSRGRFERWQPERVAVTGVVAQAGVLDLRAAYELGLGGGAVEAFLGHPPGPADDPVEPLRQVPLGVPVRCVHGRDDHTVPISQSISYVDAATAAGGDATLTQVAGDHFVVTDPDSAAWARTLTLLDALQ
jgi:acetyl esterase/lipase